MAINMNRKMIGSEVDTFDPECTLGTLLESIQYLIQQYGADASVDKTSYKYDGGYYYAVMKQVPETDEEMEKRIAQETEWHNQREDVERKQYEAMKVKFEGTK
jgi:hypothetical protein